MGGAGLPGLHKMGRQIAASAAEVRPPSAWGGEQCRIASTHRRRQRDSLLSREPFRLPFDANPVPQLQIQQPPNPVIMIAILRPMFGKQTFNGLALEISALQTPRPSQ